MSQHVDPSTLKKRDCEEQVCELCGEKYTYNELWNYEFKEWDAACGQCEEDIIEYQNAEYFVKQGDLW